MKKLYLPLLCCLLPLPLLAQVAPDAGQTLIEVNRPAPQSADGAVQLPQSTAAAVTGDATTRFSVSRIVLDGGADMAPALADVEATLARQRGELTLADLQSLARDATQQLRAQGYALAQIVVPAQTLAGGVVHMQVLPGTLSGVALDNGSAVRDATLDRIVGRQLPRGKPLQSRDLERAFLLTSDLPGVGGVNGALSAGAGIGATQLGLQVAPGKPVSGALALDNYGNRYTGETRVSGSLDWANPSGRGDRLRAQLVASEEALFFGRLAYEWNLGGDGLKLGTALIGSRYELGEDFSALDAGGEATTLQVSASWPLLRRLQRNVLLTAGYERRDLRDEVVATRTVTEKNADVLVLGIEANVQDAWGGGGSSRARLYYSRGELEFDSAAAAQRDALGPRTAGSFDKWRLSLSRTQSLSARTNLRLALDYQGAASRNLDSSEKFALGGPYAVIAYPTGEGMVDEGLLSKAELLYQLSSWLQGSLYYDYARGHVAYEQYRAGDNRQDLRGYGVGMAWGQGAFNAELNLGMRSTDAALSAPDRRPRLWLQVGWQY